MKQAENRPARQVTLHLTLPILVTLTLLTAAFSTGSPVFLMPALLIALLCLSGIYGVFRWKWLPMPPPSGCSAAKM